MNNYENIICHWISDKFCNSVIVEAFIYPSPGLVSAIDNGSHNDMDIFTFINSGVALKKYFFKATKVGINQHDSSMNIFLELKKIGIEAEKEMYIINRGVNTHKGTIFLSLVVCAAFAMLFRQKKINNEAELFKEIKNISEEFLTNELREFKYEKTYTTGERAYKELGIAGIRGELLNGLKIIERYSLPELKKLLKNGYNNRKSLVHTLVLLMSLLDDTTLLNRKFSIYRLNWVKNYARQVLDKGSIFSDEGKECLNKMNIDFKKNNISPGGSADLLVVTYAIYTIQDNLSELEAIYNHY